MSHSTEPFDSTNLTDGLVEVLTNNNFGGLDCQIDVVNCSNVLPENESLNVSEFDSTFADYSPTTTVSAIVITIFGLVLLIGIVGNLLVLITIAAVKSMHTTVNRCLFSLALADLVILVVLPMNPIVDEFAASGFLPGRDFCNFLNVYDRGASVCSVLIFVYVTIDRYFAVCHPLKSRQLWTGRKTYVILASIWIASFALSAPYLITSIYEEYEHDNKTFYYCYWDTDNQRWMVWYDTCISFALFIVPVPFFILLYGRMIHLINTSIGQPGTDSTGDEVVGRRRRLQAVILLLTVVIIFTVSQVPFVIIVFFDYFFPSVFTFRRYDVGTFAITWFCRILIYVNSASNPIIYFTLSTNFRHGFRQVFCHRQRKTVVNQTQVTNSSSHVSSGNDPESTPYPE